MSEVKCRICGEISHIANDYDGPDGPRDFNQQRFRHDRAINGAMFRLKPSIKMLGVVGFPENAGTFGDRVKCPLCGSPYLAEGPVKLVGERDVDPETYPHLCGVCGFRTQTARGLRSHLKKHKEVVDYLFKVVDLATVVAAAIDVQAVSEISTAYKEWAGA